MGKLVATEYVSLDGVMDEPGHWSFDFWSDEAARFKLDELGAAEAQLLGRKTYEGFAAAWPAMQDEAGFADKMNAMPKYVVSATLQTADWTNSHIIRDNVIEEINKLRQRPGGDLLLAGSGALFDTLMQADLIDEYRLMLYPVILGTGLRLFKEGIAKKPLRLTSTRPLSKGVTVLTYEPVR